MNRFTNQGRIHYPTNKFLRPIKRYKKGKTNVIINECFCPNGHSLIDDNFMFCDDPGIKIKVKSNGNDEGFLVLSPKFGDYSRISMDIKLNNGDILEMFCPECNVPIPVYSSCYVCDNQMLTLFTSDDHSYSNCVGVCQKVGCHNSKMVANSRMLSSVVKSCL